MKAKRFMGLVLVLLLFVVPSAFANNIGLTLADLLKPGSFVLVGDKKFYGFTDYLSISTGANASPINPVKIGVVPLIETINGIQEWGLRFQSAFYSAGSNSTQDTAFRYNVTTVFGTDIIADNFLRVGGLGVTGNGSVSVEELVKDDNNVGVTFKQVGIIPGIGEIDSVQKFFAPQDILIILNDFVLGGWDAGSTASMSNVDQLFSQTGAPVPEPSTMLLLGFGLIGLAGYGRKKFFKK